MTMIPHEIKKLNPEQKKAVTFGKGPLLIIAGAGTGKTTVITERIKHLITTGLAKPQEILALTFTEKAAREMEERVDQAMPYGYTSMWIMTFHSFCDRILRQEGLHIGLTTNYRLLTEADAVHFVRSKLYEMDLNYFRPLGSPNKFVSGMLTHFSRLQDEDVSPLEYLEWIKSQKKPGKKMPESEKFDIIQYEELAYTYSEYQKLKAKEGVVDFADLISNCLTLFRSRPNILKRYQDQFKFILVDEFQDSNIAQNELIRLLAGKAQNITAVADDDQSIYKFRGAAVSNVLQFRKNYKKATLTVLTKNYRSTQTILDAAYRLISHNNPDRLEVKEKIDKHLIAQKKEIGVQPQFIHADRVENEAALVIKEMKRLVAEEKYEYKDIALLVRANNHAEPFVRALEQMGIPYQFLGPGQLYRQPEVRDLIAYLEIIANPTNDSAFTRVISMDHFMINPRDSALLNAFANKNTLSVFEATEIVTGMETLDNVVLPRMSNQTHETLKRLIEMVHRHLTLLKKETAGQILFYFLEDAGILKKALENTAPFNEVTVANMSKFFGKLKSYEMDHEDASVPVVLDWLRLHMELGESPLASDSDWSENNAVTILTVHSAKGLEFPAVFLVNLVALRFPSTERREQIPIPHDLIKEVLPEGDYHEQEERRLFYVGITRAKQRLYLTAANYYGEGKREKKLSPFIVETLGKAALQKPLDKEPEQLSFLDWQQHIDTKVIPHIPQNVQYLSYSRIEAFRVCPLHYYLRYIIGVKPPVSPAQTFGVSVHAVLKGVYERVMQKQTITEEMVDDLLRQKWSREGFKHVYQEKALFKQARVYLLHYVKNNLNNKSKTRGVEIPFNLNLGREHNFLKIGGMIDRVDERSDGSIEIIDYKTGKLPQKKTKSTDVQLSIYALAAHSIAQAPFYKKPLSQILLTLYYFDGDQSLTVQKSPADLEKLKQDLVITVADIAQSDFRCSGGPLCVSCEYSLWCGGSNSY